MATIRARAKIGKTTWRQKKKKKKTGNFAASFPVSYVTSPVKLVGKIRLERLANNGKSKMAAPSQGCDFSKDS